MEHFTEIVDDINNKEDFLKFMGLLLENLKNNPDEWENKSLKSYLDAIAAWIENMEGYYQNIDQTIPNNINWKVFADILTAATMYE